MALTDKLKAIADAIRGKTGKTATMTMDEMVTEIESIPTGGDTTLEDAFVSTTWAAIKNYSNSRVTSIKKNAFCTGYGLQSVSFPNVTMILEGGFDGCSDLESINFPKLTRVDNKGFSGCEHVTEFNFPLVTRLGESAFISCSRCKKIICPNATSAMTYAFAFCNLLESVDISSATSIGSNSFQYDYSLVAVIIRQENSACTLGSSLAFRNCYHFYGTVNATYNPNGLKDGYIYVPDSLVDSYKSATNWSALASQIKGLSELPEELQ